MSLHVEWIEARHMSTSVVTGGTEIGMDEVDPGLIALVLNYDEAVVIEGTRHELLAALARATRQVEQMPETGDQPPETPSGEIGDDAGCNCGGCRAARMLRKEQG